MPTASTGSAGAASTRTKTVGDADGDRADAEPRADATARGAGRSSPSLRQKRTSSTAVVDTTAATAAGHIRRKNVAPETCSPCSTMRFVRFEPGRKSDAAFDMNTDAVEERRLVDAALAREVEERPA